MPALIMSLQKPSSGSKARVSKERQRRRQSRHQHIGNPSVGQSPNPQPMMQNPTQPTFGAEALSADPAPSWVPPPAAAGAADADTAPTAPPSGSATANPYAYETDQHDYDQPDDGEGGRDRLAHALKHSTWKPEGHNRKSSKTQRGSSTKGSGGLRGESRKTGGGGGAGVWIIVCVALVAIGVFFVAFKDRILQKKEIVKIEENLDDLLEQREMEEYIRTGEELRARYQGLVQHRQKLLERFAQNQKTAAENNLKFKDIFAQHKASFDEDILNFEDEQRLDTAFMLKTDLDDKKKKMIELGETLGKEMKELRRAVEGTDAQIKELVEYYNQTYADPIHMPATGNSNGGGAPQQQRQGQMQMQGQMQGGVAPKRVKWADEHNKALEKIAPAGTSSDGSVWQTRDSPTPNSPAALTGQASSNREHQSAAQLAQLPSAYTAAWGSSGGAPSGADGSLLRATEQAFRDVEKQRKGGGENDNGEGFPAMFPRDGTGRTTLPS